MHWSHLGGCADLAIMAGSGAPCPALSGVKARRPVAFAGFLAPGCRPDAGDLALEKPKRKQTTMTIERPMFPPVDPTRRHLLTIAAGGAAALATTAPVMTSTSATDRRALEAYASWLFMERRILCGELWPQMGAEAERYVSAG